VVSLNRLHELDYTYSKKLAAILDYDGIMRKFLQVITLTGTAVAWLLILPFFFYFDMSFRQQAYSMFIINAIMTLVVYIIKLIVRRPRPEFKDDRFLSVSFDIYSFPSGHATRAAYVSILMPIYTPWLAWFWYGWAILMIMSRLLLGVHYISDILFGLVLGSLSMYVLFQVGLLPYFPMF